MAKLTSVCLIISLAASNLWPLHQMNVRNAFLNGALDEAINMDSLPGFRAEREYSGKVYCLLKSLYGLKPFPQAWFNCFSEVIISLGFTRCLFDHTCFTHRRRDSRSVILLVYVDDIILQVLMLRVLQGQEGL